MGNYATLFKDFRGNTVSEKTRPDRGDWIIAHSAATGLAVVEVERLWARFKQLGCTNEGVLTQDVFNKPPASTDIFAKNILRMMIDNKGVITFQTFLNAMNWAECASNEDKLSAIFNMLNNGQNVPKEILLRIVTRLYPDNSQNDNATIAETILQEMDDENRGYITKQQWLKWSKAIPSKELEGLLSFATIPAEINEEAHRAFTSQATPKVDQTQPFTDAMVSDLAEKVFKRDWHFLANHLGFTTVEVAGLEEAYPEDVYRQAYMMLRNWKLREGRQATVQTMERALRASRMNDIAMAYLP